MPLGVLILNNKKKNMNTAGLQVLMHIPIFKQPYLYCRRFCGHYQQLRHKSENRTKLS